MGVELYFVKPGPSGKILFPFWDQNGEPLVPTEYRVVTSLKWAMGMNCLADAGLIDAKPIPPERLAAGSLGAMRDLLAQLAKLHPDFRLRVDEVGDDFDALGGLLEAFIAEEDWLGADAALRQRAAKHESGQLSSLHALLYEIRRAANDGFFGCWSY